MLASPMVDATAPIHIKVEGKSTVAIDETNTYFVTAVGGPAEEFGGNYSFIVTVEGQNVADAIISPANGKSSSGVFQFNFTAPSAATEMTIVVNVTSTGPMPRRITSSPFT